MNLLKKIVYYGTILPPIYNTLMTYIKATQELARQLKLLNEQLVQENQFNEDNSDD